jgi:FMN phosphatase YigB (HAD superfamily)
MSEDGPAGMPMAHWPAVAAIDGAALLLESLVSEGRVACIATNAADSRAQDIRAALARVGLDRHVGRIFCYAEIGARKVSEAFWSAVLSRLDASPEAVVMIGDSLEQDVLAPMRSGIRSIWFNPAGRPLPPGLDVPMVASLPEAAREIVRLEFDRG